MFCSAFAERQQMKEEIMVWKDRVARLTLELQKEAADRVTAEHEAAEAAKQAALVREAADREASRLKQQLAESEEQNKIREGSLAKVSTHSHCSVLMFAPVVRSVCCSVRRYKRGNTRRTWMSSSLLPLFLPGWLSLWC